MKNIARLAILSALMGLSAKAAPFMAIGDGAELFVTGTALVQADNNIYLASTNEISDTIYSVQPGLDLIFGKGSNTTGDVRFIEEIRRYSSTSMNNVNLPHFSSRANYANGVTKGSVYLTYDKLSQNDFGLTAIGSFVHYTDTAAGANAELGMTEKTTLGAGLNWNKNHYETGGGTIETLILPIDVYFAATPNLQASLGYQYEHTDYSTTANHDNWINLGARGSFTPLLTGQFRVGYMTRSFDSGGKQTSLSYSGNLTYAYSQKTSFGLMFNKGFGSSAMLLGSTKNSSTGLTLATQYNEQWSFNAGISLASIEYPARTDNYLTGQFGINYIYSRSISFAASVLLSKATSDLAASEFSHNVYSFSANFRY